MKPALYRAGVILGAIAAACAWMALMAVGAILAIGAPA